MTRHRQIGTYLNSAGTVTRAVEKLSQWRSIITGSPERGACAQLLGANPDAVRFHSCDRGIDAHLYSEISQIPSCTRGQTLRERRQDARSGFD